MNVLIYRTGRLGDFIVAVPAMSLIRQAYPQARITLLTCTSTNQRFAQKTWTYADPNKPLPWLDFVMPGLIDEAMTFGSLRDWAGLWRIRRELRRRRFDVAFFLPFSEEPFINRFKKWIFLHVLGTGAPVYGLRTDDGALFPALRRTHHEDASLHAARQAPAVRDIVSRENVVLRTSPAAEDWAAEQWRSRGWTERPVIAVFPGGTYAHKRWGPENFAAVCGRLAEDPAFSFVLIGSAAERPLTTPIAETLRGRHWNACGEVDLMQLAALLRRCVLFIGNDSGPVHLAARLGVPTVVLMSAVHAPGLWEPRGAEFRVVREAVPCVGCRSETHCPLESEACIRAIDVARVTAEAHCLLKRENKLLRHEIPALRTKDSGQADRW